MSEETKNQPVEHVLPSGKKAVFTRYTGRHIQAATKESGSDTSKIPYIIISKIVKIDGNPINYDDLLDMDGPDVMKLMEIWGTNAGN